MRCVGSQIVYEVKETVKESVETTWGKGGIGFKVELCRSTLSRQKLWDKSQKIGSEQWHRNTYS